MKRVLLFASLVFAFPVILFAKDIDVVFIGITQGSAPAFEETLDRRVRENLSTLQEIALTDYLQTQSFRRKIRFDESPTVSRKLIESLKQYSSDSAVFVWGRLKHYTIAGERRSVIKAFIRGEMVLTLNVYSLRYKNYAFSGDVQTSFEKPKGFIFFGDAEKEIMISASDRNEMTERLLDQAARKSASLIATIIQSERLHAAKETETAGAKSYEVPSVSDMFNVPSVEAASVNKNRKRNAPAADTLSSKKLAQPPAPDTPSSQKQTKAPAPDTLSSKKQIKAPAPDTLSSKRQPEPPPQTEKTDSESPPHSSPQIDTMWQGKKK